MKESEIIDLANHMMTIHQENLVDWSFKIINAYSTVAECRYDIKQIGFSKHFIGRITKENLKEAILHEIAHVISESSEHGEDWLNVMKDFGYPNAKRFIEVESLPEHRFGIFFQNEMIKGFYRKPRQKTIESVRKMFIPERKYETFGKLEFREVAA
jgi:hypothetical protein